MATRRDNLQYLDRRRLRKNQERKDASHAARRASRTSLHFAAFVSLPLINVGELGKNIPRAGCVHANTGRYVNRASKCAIKQASARMKRARKTIVTREEKRAGTCRHVKGETRKRRYRPAKGVYRKLIESLLAS